MWANGIEAMNRILGKDFETEADVVKWMTSNKSTAALKIFGSDENVTMPDYILSAIENE